MRRAFRILAALSVLIGFGWSQPAPACMTLTGAGGACGGAAPSGVTWNPLDKGAGINLTNGNLTAAISTAVTQMARATTSETTGTWCWQQTATTAANSGFGLANATASVSSFLGSDTNSLAFYPNGAIFFNNGTVATIQTFTTGSVVTVAWDVPHTKIWFRTDSGLWNNSGTDDPATNTGGFNYIASGPLNGTLFPSVSLNANGDQNTVNFGQGTFAPACPSGFVHP